MSSWVFKKGLIPLKNTARVLVFIAKWIKTVDRLYMSSGDLKIPMQIDQIITYSDETSDKYSCYEVLQVSIRDENIYRTSDYKSSCNRQCYEIRIAMMD